MAYNNDNNLKTMAKSEELDGPAVSALGVRSVTLSNVKDQSLDG
jgi:hypothetical protein